MTIKILGNSKPQQWLAVILMAAGFCLGQEARATAWLDFAQGPGPVSINSDNTNNAAVILRKSATCPKNGYLLTTGTASAHVYPGESVFLYSLTRDAAAPHAFDFTHSGTIRPQLGGGLGVYDIPFSIQRVDKCATGQTITLLLVSAVSGGFLGDIAVYSPTLVIQFFDVLI